MISQPARALLSRLWRQHRLALATMATGLALFEFVITRIAPVPGEAGFLGGLLSLLPPQAAEFIGDELALASTRGVIAFGYLHPLFLTILSAWTIRVACGALAGEIGRGTMDLLAARPVTRWAHVLAAWIIIAVGLAVLVGIAWSATAIGLRLRPLGVSPREILVLPAVAWLMFMSWAGVALVISALRREAGGAIAWTSGIIATSFAVEFLGRVWQPVAWARPLSLFAYYRPQDILRTGFASDDVLRLGAVALVTFFGAALAFDRRDL